MRDHKSMGFRKFRLEVLEWLVIEPINFIPPIRPRDRTLIMKPITQSKC